MKFTKLMALVLVLLMTVAVFAACGDEPAQTTPSGGEETTLPSGEETTLPSGEETTDPDVVGDCDHKGSLKRTGNKKEATCAEEGYTEYQCKKCGEIEKKPIEALPHTYGFFKSVDGKYTKEVCVVCRKVLVEDESGAIIEDASAIKFPAFAGSFDGVDTLEIASELFEGFSLSYSMANIVKNDPNGEIYLNIPSGNSSLNPNGYLEIVDEKAALVGKAFTLTFRSRYDETPEQKTALLTWTIDGKAQALLSADLKGNYIDAKGANVAKASAKGWDNFKVEVTASGDYTIYLNDVQIATGKVASTGATSVLRFFDDKSQFEAYLDEIIIVD